jgi:hypothetical protein
MTPGVLADKALTLVNQASGDLGYMVVKRRLERRRLALVVQRLRSATQLLEEASQC